MTESTNRPAVRVRRSAASRTPLTDIQKTIHSYLDSWATVKDAGTARDAANKLIKAWFARGGDGAPITVNETGSQLYEFAAPLDIGGRKFTGIENTKRTASFIDPDLVDEWLDKLPADQREAMAARLFKQVTEFQLQTEVLFTLNQEGILPDAALDSMYTTEVTWALNVKRD